MIYYSYIFSLLISGLLVLLLFPIYAQIVRYPSQRLSFLLLPVIFTFIIILASIMIVMAYAKGDLCFISLLISHLNSATQVETSYSFLNAYWFLSLVSRFADLRPINSLLFLSFILYTSSLHICFNLRSFSTFLKSLPLCLAFLSLLMLPSTSIEALTIPRTLLSFQFFSLVYLLSLSSFARIKLKTLIVIACLFVILIHPLSAFVSIPFALTILFPDIHRHKKLPYIVSLLMIVMLLMVVSSDQLNTIYRGNTLDSFKLLEIGYLSPVYILNSAAFLLCARNFISSVGRNDLPTFTSLAYADKFLLFLSKYMVLISILATILTPLTRLFLIINAMTLILIFRLSQLRATLSKALFALYLFTSLLSSSVVASEVSSVRSESQVDAYYGSACPSRSFTVGFTYPLSSLKQALYSYDSLTNIQSYQ